MDTANLSEKVNEVVRDLDFEQKKYQIAIETNHGNITLDLFPDLAPEHCRNIIGLTKLGFYDELNFHRIVKGFVIQGGCPEGDGTGGPGYHIKAEFNDRPHKAGVLSMARAQDPDSAGSQFFICLADVPYLDGQYTVFGQTADEESLSVVLDIGKAETGPGDRPREEVKILKAMVLGH